MAGIDDPRIRPVGTVLIVLAILGLLVANGVGVWLAYTGLRPIATISEPGSATIAVSPGMYVFVRPSSDRPDNAGILQITAKDPDAARITVRESGSWLTINNVQYDALVEARVHESPLEITIEGDQAHFPITVQRAQREWMRFVGIVTVSIAGAALVLLVTGIVIAVRNRQRRIRALLDYMGDV